MYCVHTHLTDNTSPYVIEFCKSYSEAKRSARTMKRDYAPNQGVAIDALSLADCLYMIGYPQLKHNKARSALPYLQYLIPYCTPKLASYLSSMLVRICGYRLQKIEFKYAGI